ncbi:MAG: ribosome biogenesis GTP-binding protein YihA/YsxC [Agriterribacter sp.]
MVITDAAYLISSPDYTKCPPPVRPEYVFTGRSNVGKSSLINMLCNKQKLAKTSASPGKTQMINHFIIESVSGKEKTQWYIVDLPGYGFAKVSQQQRKHWEKMTKDYLTKRPNIVNVFALIDSRHSPQKSDLDFLNQLGEWGIPFTIVFTKTDKSTQQDVSRNIKAFLNAMKKNWQFLPQHFTTSSIKQTGRNKILDAIDNWNEAFKNQGGISEE